MKNLAHCDYDVREGIEKDLESLCVKYNALAKNK
jgi:hypothetical protein